MNTATTHRPHAAPAAPPDTTSVPLRPQLRLLEAVYSLARTVRGTGDTLAIVAQQLRIDGREDWADILEHAGQDLATAQEELQAAYGADVTRQRGEAERLLAVQLQALATTPVAMRPS